MTHFLPFFKFCLSCFCFCFLFNTTIFSQTNKIEDILAIADLKWDKMPKRWQEAPFLGNGMLGLMIWQEGKTNIRLDLGRGDAQEHREIDKSAAPLDMLFLRGRLLIGNFTFSTKGEIKDCNLRLDLFNAELTGTINTTIGEIKIRAYVHATKDLIIFEINEIGNEQLHNLKWNPAKPISPRPIKRISPIAKKLYPPNPAGSLKKSKNISIWEQKLLPSAETAIAWAEKNEEHSREFFISIRHNKNNAGVSESAEKIIDTALNESSLKRLTTHRNWWNKFYSKTFLSISDEFWQSFYWIQMYKLASATRGEGGMLIDTMGPWAQPTAWCGVWWNLNIQLTYWPCYAGNHLELADSLRFALRDNWETFSKNVPEKYQKDSAAIGRCSGQECRSDAGFPGTDKTESQAEAGNLIWACHNLWLHYRMTMDKEILREELFPLLKRAVNFYLHYLKKDENGTLHIPKTHSPEYADVYDANYDLALLKWGLQTLIESDNTLKTNDELYPVWQETLKKLTPFPSDTKQGFLIGKDKKLTSGHRHFSHLLMAYPLHIYTPDTPERREIILKTLRHWHSMRGGLQGYSFTGGSLISSLLKDGEKSYEYLQGLRPFLTKTTMYAEGPNPVIETPPSAAQSIHEMLLQSYGDIICIFPAIPKKWSDIEFCDLRAEGAFLVSAKRKNGKTISITIKSLAGYPCKIQHGLNGKIQCTGSKIKNINNKIVELSIKKGETATLYIK